ncbi:DUF2680 domain-containing protein [Peribacillus sp. NPDC096379]|uniref:DUF2680 domain-containing protein n=1 Tax=Peribacillus sp. NPDC096379 TaxID=3364393 RepID=UPI003801C1F1
MNKLLIALLTISFVTSNFEITAFAEKDNQESEVKQEQQIEFTQKQQDELAVLHKEMLAKKIEIVHKYVEFGAISKEKSAMIVKHMEKHYQKLVENGFQPHHTHHHKRPAE